MPIRKFNCNRRGFSISIFFEFLIHSAKIRMHSHQLLEIERDTAKNEFCIHLQPQMHQQSECGRNDDKIGFLQQLSVYLMVVKQLLWKCVTSVGYFRQEVWQSLYPLALCDQWPHITTIDIQLKMKLNCIKITVRCGKVRSWIVAV